MRKYARNLPDAIEWHEGMLLAPQHFQQFSRRLDNLPAYLVLASNPFGWGIRNLVIDPVLLAAGTFRVTELEAVMPDGMAVWHTPDDPGNPVLDLSLAPFTEQTQQGELVIHLAVIAGAVRGQQGTAGDRYRSIAGAMVVDETSEAEPVEIPRRRPNLQLLAGDTPSARYISLPIATVVRDNELFRLGSYVPPLLEVGDQSPLREMCASLLRRLREKAVFLAKQTSIPSSKLEDRLEFLELKDKLRSIVVLLPYFEAVLATDPIHPYPLYLALASLSGPLSLLRPGGVAPPPVPYRHGELFRTYAEAVQVLDGMLAAVSQTYREIKFRFDAGQFSLKLEPGWLGDRLIVGLRGQSERDLATWMEGSLIGADTVLESLREKRIYGAGRTRIERADELGLAAGSGISLYSIRPDPEFVFPDRPLMIFNPAESAAALRPSEIILYAGE